MTNEIDVVVLTRNSEHTLAPVLRSIFDQVPVGELIIVDGNSSDSTVRIARKFGARILSGDWRLGKARYMGARATRTDWFCFVDSDVVLLPKWYEHLEQWRSMQRVAWASGLTIEHSKILNRYSLSKSRRFARFGSYALSNSLVRRDIVLACSAWLDSSVHAGEDWVFYQHVRDKGMVSLLVTDATCLHLPDSFYHDIYALYRNGRSDRLRREWSLLFYVPLKYLDLFREGLARFLLENDLRIVLYFLFFLGPAYSMGFLLDKNPSVERLFDNIDCRSKMLTSDTSHIEKNVQLMGVESRVFAV
jgi:glycosyltransferase involved in cell wall biosynthesis